MRPKQHIRLQLVAPDKQPEKKANKIDFVDAAIKISSTLAAIAGIIIGIYQFNLQQRQNETHQFKVKLWDRKLETYSNLSQVTGDIVVFSDKTDPKFDSLVLEYSQIYFSSMPLVQDSLVEKRLIDFDLALADYKTGIKNLKHLKKKQYRLMQGLGESIKELNRVIDDK